MMVIARSVGVFALAAGIASAVSASAAADVVFYEAGKTPGARIEKSEIPVARGDGASDQCDYKLVENRSDRNSNVRKGTERRILI